VWINDQNLPSFGRKGGMCAGNGRNLYYSCGINSADQRLNETWMTDIPLGIASQNKSDFTFEIFPNPCENGFYIQGLAKHSKPVGYHILNANGLEIVAITPLTESPTWIDISFLAPGMYIIELQYGDGWPGAKKIIKH
ncbi:MAG: T9SS type A sorting domain-containing protein, partial [Bacteroidota bacterium]